MSFQKPPRCNETPGGTAGCMNFGNAKNAGGVCNACAAGEMPYVLEGESGPGRIVEAEEDPFDYSAPPDDAEMVQKKLDESLAAAQAYAEDCPPELIKAVSGLKDGFIPFSKQRKVQPNQQLFSLEESLYVGSEYAASDIGLLRGVGISRIINISSGSRTVPNHGEQVADWDVVYRHFPLEDRIGFSVQTAGESFDEAIELIMAWLADGHRVLLHCSAGLSRSASMAMAFLMHARGATLQEAVAAFTAARGRQPACTPTYWTTLMRLERRLRGEGPSFDYTAWICDDVGGAGEPDRSTGLQIATDEEVARLLHEEHDWDAAAVVDALLK